jgi:glycosyltransferase involved in cell wall biosynthesis
LRIAIATVQVPFIKGGAEMLVELLKEELVKRGHQAEIVTIPFKWYPTETLLNSMIMGRMIDLTEINGEKIDIVIAMKFPAYFLKHPNKIIWLMHQHRQAYDLWGTENGDLHQLPDGEFMRNTILLNDNQYIMEAKKIFTISKNTSYRLKKFNNIDSISLYHPPKNYEKLNCKNYEDFIFYPSRLDKMKRQRLLVESAAYLKSNAKIYIAGTGSQNEIEYLENLIKKYKLQDKVKLLGYISEEEKIDFYSRCLAVYFGAYDEDYGYITLESFFSKKACIVHKDAGGPLEFVKDGENGYIIDADAQKLANKIDFLYANKSLAKKLGENGYSLMKEMKLDWDYVIKKLLGK